MWIAIALLHGFIVYIAAGLTRNKRVTDVVALIMVIVAIAVGNPVYAIFDLLAISFGYWRALESIAGAIPVVQDRALTVKPSEKVPTQTGLSGGIRHVVRNQALVDGNATRFNESLSLIVSPVGVPEEKNGDLRVEEVEDTHSVPNAQDPSGTTGAQKRSTCITQQQPAEHSGDEVTKLPNVSRADQAESRRREHGRRYEPDGTPSVIVKRESLGIPRPSFSADLRNMDYALGYSLGSDTDWPRVIGKICEDPSYRDWKWAEAPPAARGSYQKWFPGFSKLLITTEGYEDALEICNAESRRIVFAHDEVTELRGIAYMQDEKMSSRIKSTLRGERLGYRAIEGRISFIGLQARAVRKIGDRLEGYANAVSD